MAKTVMGVDVLFSISRSFLTITGSPCPWKVRAIRGFEREPLVTSLLADAYAEPAPSVLAAEAISPVLRSWRRLMGIFQGYFSALRLRAKPCLARVSFTTNRGGAHIE
jgi:hypothetical protein